MGIKNHNRSKWNRKTWPMLISGRAGGRYLQFPLRRGHPDPQDPFDIGPQEGPEGFEIPVQTGMGLHQGAEEMLVLLHGKLVQGDGVRTRVRGWIKMKVAKSRFRSITYRNNGIYF
jgi:hypothetical protein